MHTDPQVLLLRWLLQNGSTQREAAQAAGMSVRSARKWQRGPLPSAAKRAHDWKTRTDPLGEVWDTEIRPFLDERDGMPSSTDLLRMIEARHPGRFGHQHLRTLQRRIHQIRKQWEAAQAPRPFPQGLDAPLRDAVEQHRGPAQSIPEALSAPPQAARAESDAGQATPIAVSGRAALLLR